MNIFKSLYCRVFQFGFKIAIPLMPYRNPRILNSLDDVPDVFKTKGIDNVLLVTDRKIRNLGLTKRLEDRLKKKGIKLSVYDEVSANPTTEQVYEARDLYIKKKCQALIGFGGGSSMDCAKAVGALIAYPGRTLDRLGGILKVMRKTPLIIAVPTTAGTGSETTLAAVVVDRAKRHKYALMSFPLIPSYAVLDPETTRPLPPAMTAGTGMDVLVHATEAYIGRSTTPLTRKEALKAIHLLFNNLTKAYTNGNNMEARRSMLRASFLAGHAFTVSYVGYCHAVSHALGGRYNLPHGQTNAILIPYVLEGYGAAIYPKLKDLAMAAGLASYDTDEAEAAKRYIKAIRALNAKMKIPDKIAELKREDIDELAERADREANPVYPVPVLMDKEQLKGFLYDVLPDDDKPIRRLIKMQPQKIRNKKKAILLAIGGMKILKRRKK